jgi:hypothetical protein
MVDRLWPRGTGLINVSMPDSVIVTARSMTASAVHQSPFGYRCATSVRLRIMNRPAGFSATAAANAARAS